MSNLTKDPELLRETERTPLEADIEGRFSVRYLRGSVLNAYDHDCLVTNEGLYLIPTKDTLELNHFERPKFLAMSSIAQCKKKMFFGPNLNIILVDGSKLWLQCFKRSQLIDCINKMK